MLDYDHFIGGGMVSSFGRFVGGVEICLRCSLEPHLLASFRGLHFLPGHARIVTVSRI